MMSAAMIRSRVFSRHPFTIEEDAKLIELVRHMDSSHSWDFIASHMPGRSPRQCRERYIGYLCPSIRVEPWTDAEDQLLLSEISQFGHKWTTIAQHFNGRSGNDVKNRWYSHLKEISEVGPDGSLQMHPHADDAVPGHKKKRRRKLVSAYEVAMHRVAKVARGGLLPVPQIQIPIAPLRFLSAGFQLPPLIPRAGRIKAS
jgi:hypothetical protein